MNGVVLLAYSLAFLFLFVGSAGGTKSILAPAPLWNLAWSVLFLAAAGLGSEYIYDVTAVTLLATAAASFNLGALIAGDFRREARAKVVRPPATVPLALIWASVVVSLVGALVLSKAFGTSILSIRSVSQLFSTGQQNATKLFRGEVALPTIPKIAFSVLQIGWALAGFRQRLQPGRRGNLPVLVGLALAAFLYSATTTQRSYLLVPIVWWVGGYIAAMVWLGQRRLPMRTVIRAAFVVGVLVLVVVYLRAIRTGGSSANLSGSNFQAGQLWAAGYIPAFSDWYVSGQHTVGHVPGFFGGITGVLGGGSGGSSGGLTGGFQVISLTGARSNAPTIMRDAFAVAGPVGGYVIMVMLGAIFQLIYRRALRGGLIAAALYAAAVACIFWATNAWFMSYGARVLAAIGLVILASTAARSARTTRRRPRLSTTHLGTRPSVGTRTALPSGHA